jgi:cation diffusion facilitator family transporter
MAAKPADEDHPFGHGRVEYIAAFVVSFLVLEVGFTFLKDSIEKIRTPEMLNFQWISLGILCISVGVKVWLGLFNRKLGKRINSKVMMAVFTDSMGDVITTSATIFSLLFFRFTNINIDGFVGVGVSLVVMWAGVGIAKDTLEPLIGAAVDPYLYEVIKQFVENYDGVEGTHDLIVHNYGPNRSMASIHAEVPNNVDIEISHEIVDRIERDAMKELGIFLVVHMDPIEMDNEESEHIRTQVVSALEELDPQCSIHDFRLVRGQYQVNVIFDMVVPITYEEAARESLRVALAQKLKEVDERYCCVITIEHSFCSVKQTEE